MYSEYRLMKVSQCLPMNEGVTAKEGASCFVNPLTMEWWNHASGGQRPRPYGTRFNVADVGKGLLKDNVPLVNIVEKMSTWSC